MAYTPRFGFTIAQWDPTTTTHTTRSENSGSNSVAVGDVVVVAVPYRLVGNTAIAVTDNLGNTYTEITAASFISTSDSSAATRFYYSVITVAGTCTITATATTAASFFGIFAYCYSGLDTTSPFHVAATFKRITSADGSDAGAPSNSCSVTAAPVLQIGYLLATSGPSNGARWAAGTGFTNRLTGQKSNSAADYVKFEDTRVTSNGSVTATFIGTSTAGNTAIVCNLTFIESSSSTTTGSGTIAGAGAATGTGATTSSGNSTLAGTATASATASSVASANSALAGTSTVTSTGVATIAGICSSAGTATTTAVGAATSAGVSTSAVSATATATAGANVDGVSALAGSATASATAAATSSGDASAAGISTVTGDGIQASLGSATIAGSSTATATGIAITAGISTLTGASTATAEWAVTSAGASTLAGAATVSGTAAASIDGNSSIDGVATLGAIGIAIAKGYSSINGNSSVTAVGFDPNLILSYSTIVGGSTTTAIGQTIVRGTSNISGLTSFSVIGAASIRSTGSIAAVSTNSGTEAATSSGVGQVSGAAHLIGTSSGATDILSETKLGTPSFDGWIYSAFLGGNKPSGYLTSPTILGIDLPAGKTSGGEGGSGDCLNIFGYSFGQQLKMGKPEGVQVFFRNPAGDNVWHQVENYRFLMKAQSYDANQALALNVQLGSLGGAPNGALLDMKVTVNGTDAFFQKDDGTILSYMPACFTVQPGRIWFVSKFGDDNTAKPNDIRFPARYWQRYTPNSSIALGIWATTTPQGDPGVRAGDTIVVMGDGGIWNDHVGFDNRLLRLRNHTGTAPNGVIGNGYIHITGYSGPVNGHAPHDVHYVDPPGGGGGIHGVNTAYLNLYGMYVSISNIHIECDPTTIADGGPINFQTGAHFWRVHNCELGPWPSTINPKCGGVSGQGYDCVVRFNKIRDIDGDRTQQLNHGVYLGDAAGVCSKRWNVSYNDIYNILAGSGVQFNNNSAADTFDGNQIHHNRIKTVAKYGLNLANSITSADCYNNIIIDAGLNSIRFDSLTAVTVINVTYNTCYQSRSSGAYQYIIANTGGGLTTGVVNVTHNIAAMAAGHVSSLGYTNLTSTDTAANVDQNVWYDYGAVNTNLPAKDAHGIYGNPKFTDPANGDFTCQSGGAGEAAASRANPLAVRKDFFGMARPVTGTGTPGASKNDIGATQGAGT